MAIYPSIRSTTPRTPDPEYPWMSTRWIWQWRDSSGRSIKNGAWPMANHDLRAAMRLVFLQGHHLQDHRKLLLPLPSICSLPKGARSLASSYVLLLPHIQRRNVTQEIYHRSNPLWRMPSEQSFIQTSHLSRGSAIAARETKKKRKSLLLYVRWAFQMTRGILLS
jgi:hypothetical protein